MAIAQLNGPAAPTLNPAAYTAPEQDAPTIAIGRAGVGEASLDGLVGLGDGWQNVRPHIGRSVWAKVDWTDDWTYLPFIWPRESVERMAPGVSEATMHYDFGLIDRYLSGWAVWYPYNLARAFVRILGHTPYGAALMFVGVCDAQSFDLDPAYWFAQGTQKIRAFGMEHLLDRAVVSGSYTSDGYVSRPITFNEQRRGRSRGLIGNRTTGVLTFGGTSEWSNLDIIDYLLVNFAPAGITWRASGATAALDAIVEIHRLEGLTVLQCLHRLIPRQRGLSWRLLTNGAGAIYLDVTSMLPFSVSGPDFQMPANPNQIYLDTAGRPDIRLTVDFNELAEYDYITVKGGPVTVCFSLGFGDNTIEAGWTAQSETDYIAGTGTAEDEAALHDAARSTPEFRRVYQSFRVPSDWDGTAGDPTGADPTRYPVTPICLWDGTITFAEAGVFHRPGKTFLRHLPIEEENPADADTPEYRQPLAFVLTTTEGDDPVYVHVHELDVVGKTPAHLRMGDRDLEIHIRPGRVPHVAGLNDFPAEPDSPTGIAPQYDYTEYIATVAMETDTHLEVRLAIAPISPTGREKLILVPDAVAWYVVPGTVLDIGDVQPDDATTDLRNDRDRLLNIAILAAAWYGYQRATARIEINGSISLGAQPGSLIRAVSNGAYWADIGTVVTERLHNYPENKTLIKTSFRELDFEEVAR